MSEEVSTQVHQPAVEMPGQQQEPPIVFFGIGLVLNLALIAAYGIWAYRQWKKSARRED